MINKTRMESGLQPLELVFVDMIMTKTKDDKDDSDPVYSNKMSSSLIREYLDQDPDKMKERQEAALYSNYTRERNE